MSVKVATFKKLPPTETYACSALEVQEWAKELADLRIEFGAHKSFRFDPRCNSRPKIQGTIVASLFIDHQLKPALFFYPIPGFKYPESAKNEFLERMDNDLKKWLEDQLSKHETDMVGREMILLELRDDRLAMHRLRYL
jgi:hypothetical protein